MAVSRFIVAARGSGAAGRSIRPASPPASSGRSRAALSICTRVPNPAMRSPICRTACGGATPSSSPVTSSVGHSRSSTCRRPACRQALRSCARSRPGSGASAIRGRRRPPRAASASTTTKSRPGRARPRSPACRPRPRCAPSAPRARMFARAALRRREQRPEQARLRTTAGCSAARCCATIVPIECAITCARSTPAAASARNDAVTKPSSESGALDAVRAPGAGKIGTHAKIARDRGQQRCPRVRRAAEPVQHEHGIAFAVDLDCHPLDQSRRHATVPRLAKSRHR